MQYGAIQDHIGQPINEFEPNALVRALNRQFSQFADNYLKSDPERKAAIELALNVLGSPELKSYLKHLEKDVT